MRKSRCNLPSSKIRDAGTKMFDDNPPKRLRHSGSGYETRMSIVSEARELTLFSIKESNVRNLRYENLHVIGILSPERLRYQTTLHSIIHYAIMLT